MTIKISLDLETLSTSSDAAIVQIGAVVIETGESFVCYIDPRSSENAGLHVDLETIEWWNKQDKDIRKRVMGGSTTLISALVSFKEFCSVASEGRLSEIELWAWGADFDLPVLRNAYECFMEYPFSFRNHRCLRTLAAICGVQPKRGAGHHDALYDAISQMEAYLKCMHELKTIE